MATSYDPVSQALAQYEQAKAENTASTDQLKKSYDEIYASQAAQYQNQADADIAKTETEYKGLYDRAALQQLVNERELERRQANLGLTDSGLTATQQTAIQVARGNADANIDAQKQAAIDSITLQLEQYLANVDQNRAQAYAQADYNLNTTNTTLYNQLLSQAYANQAAYEAAQIQAAATERAAQIQAQANATSAGTSSGTVDLSSAIKVMQNLKANGASDNDIYSSIYSLDSAYNLSDYQVAELLSYAGISNLTGYNNWGKRQSEATTAINTTASDILSSYKGRTYDEIFGIYYGTYMNGSNNYTKDSKYQAVADGLDKWLSTHKQGDIFSI